MDRAPHLARVLLLAAGCILAAVRPSPGQEHDPRAPLVVAAAPYPPFLEAKSGGAVAGFEAELLERFAKAEGIRVAYRLLGRFADVLRALERGEVDAGGGGIHATPERMERYEFGVYVRSGLVIVGRPGRAGVAGAGELAGLSVGVKKGATGESLARSFAARVPGIRVVSFSRTEDSYEALLAGRIDVLVDDYLHARHLVRQGTAAAILSKPLTSVGMGLAFRKDPASRRLRKRFERFIAAFSKTEEFDLLYERYFF